MFKTTPVPVPEVIIWLFAWVYVKVTALAEIDVPSENGYIKGISKSFSLNIKFSGTLYSTS